MQRSLSWRTMPSSVGKMQLVGQTAAQGVGAVHAGHRDRALARLAVVDGDDAPAIEAPGYLIFVLARGHASVAVNAAIGVAEELHSRHDRAFHPALIWQRVAFGFCMPVAGSSP